MRELRNKLVRKLILSRSGGLSGDEMKMNLLSNILLKFISISLVAPPLTTAPPNSLYSALPIDCTLK